MWISKFCKLFNYFSSNLINLNIKINICVQCTVTDLVPTNNNDFSFHSVWSKREENIFFNFHDLLVLCVPHFLQSSFAEWKEKKINFLFVCSLESSNINSFLHHGWMNECKKFEVFFENKKQTNQETKIESAF